jgi:hypothetical protein
VLEVSCSDTVVVLVQTRFYCPARVVNAVAAVRTLVDGDTGSDRIVVLGGDGGDAQRLTLADLQHGADRGRVDQRTGRAGPLPTFAQLARK